MEENKENRIKLQKSIEKVLERSEIDKGFINQKSLDEILEEFSVYHQELEYQNEELRRIQTELEKAKEHYFQLFNDAPLAYVMVNKEQKITAANYVFCDLIGMDERSLGERKIEEWISPESQDPFYFHMRKVFETGKTESLQLQVMTMEGIKTVKIHSNIMKSDAGGGMVRIAIVDLSREKQMEEALIQQNRELEEVRKKAESASAAKTQFLANMSHEIRTPLNGIMGFLQLMQETKLDSDQKEYLNLMQSSAQMLLSLLADLLDLSSIESDKINMHYQSFNVVEMLQLIVEKHRYDVAEKEVEIDLRYDERIPEEVMGDQHRLQQILNNLLGNAVKFTETGTILLEAKLMNVSEDQVLIDFTVKDTGIGIREEDQSMIFESFSQADNSNTRKYGGSGLGLTISKRLTEAMGGSIRMKSREGAGSFFAITIPFETTTTTCD